MRRYLIADLVKEAEMENSTIAQITLHDQAIYMETTEEELYNKMEKQLLIMQESVEEGRKANIRSQSGLSGGDAYKMYRYIEKGDSICGTFFTQALMRALAISEWNAAMGRIVAAPTAGSSGILPAAILTLMETRGLSQKTGVMGLFTAAGVGKAIAENACISGAQGGCQAECGSAAAMAAAALVEMMGGTPHMAAQAVAIALKNILGLVCDPVAGLVEIPCIKRNAGGVAGALAAAEMALAGIESVIPADEVIVAMKQVGDMMPAALRETSEAGLATTPTGCALCRKIF